MIKIDGGKLPMRVYLGYMSYKSGPTFPRHCHVLNVKNTDMWRQFVEGNKDVEGVQVNTSMESVMTEPS